MNLQKKCLPRIFNLFFRMGGTFAVLASVLILFPLMAYAATVDLAWDPNTESDLAGYKIYYRTADGVFNIDDSVDVGSVAAAAGRNPACGSPYDPLKMECCEYTLQLAPGTYHLSATAYDEGGNESDHSEELVHTFSVGQPVCPHPVGHLDYCRDCGPCAAGQGDCDDDDECQSGLTCPEVKGVDTCQAISPDTTPPTVTITTPTSGSPYSTSQSQLSISGMASDNVAVSTVSWTNSLGDSGTCSGTSSWSKSGIALASGQNVITVTATDAAGNPATASLTVTYTPPDTTDPTVTITAPTSGSPYSTSQSQLSISGTASDNIEVTQVSWKNSRGGSGTFSGTSSWSKSGIVLSSGQNEITVTATDAAGNPATASLTVTYTPPDTTDPTVKFTTPTSGSPYSTSQSQLSISGTASDNIEVTQVSWKNSRGGSGTFSGTSSWSKSGIALASGQNVITVTATDAAGNPATASLTVTYTPPDTTDPTVKFTTPTSGSPYSTSQSQLSISGTASDNIEVTQVSWKNSRGGSGTFSGTSSWSKSGIALASGQNVITVTATDAAGNTGTNTLTVTYTPPDNTLTIKVEDMPIKITGDDCVPSDDGVNICENGYIADNIYFAAGGTASFEVIAMGSDADGAWPTMEVWIDETPVGTVTVDSSDWKTYMIQASITRGTHEVAIAFINDDWEDPDDGLYVDKVTITTENSAPVRAPVSNAGDYQPVEEGVLVELDGFNSTAPNDNITGYYWEQTDDGVKVDLTTNPNEAEATFTAPDVETEPVILTFELTVIDAEGLQDTDTCSVQITKAVSEDSDGDGYPDDQDAFPDDPDEHLNTDGDDLGNNEDEDDDGDGMPDDWESKYRLDPLNEDDAGEDPDGDGVSNYDEYYLGTEPNHNEGNFKPDPPELKVSDDGETLSLTPLLETEEFDDPNFNDVHSQTRWEITDEDGYVVFDVTTDSSLTSMTVPKLILEHDTEYTWRVKFIDNHGGASDWSEDGDFTTEFSEEDSDGNGILDHQEVDYTLDLDDDGVPDREQSDIKCIVAESGKAQIGVSIRNAENVDSILFMEIEEPDDNLILNSKGKPSFLEFGLLHFKLLLNAPGEETVVTVHLSRAAFKKGSMYKYDPVNSEWLDYSDYAEFGRNRKKVHLTLKDGGFGDADGIENGIIVDPLAFGSESDPNSGSDSFVENIGDSLKSGAGCFISAATTSGPSDRQALSLYREFRGSEMSIVFILMVLGYVGTEIYLRFRQKRGDGAKRIGRIAM